MAINSGMMGSGSIDKVLPGMGVGIGGNGADLLSEPQGEEHAIEIEIQPDEGDEEGTAVAVREHTFGENLAEFLDDSVLSSIATDILDLIQTDEHSRREWVDTFLDGLKVLGMKYEERTQPWSDACGAYSTLLTEAVVRFQSEMIIETFPAQGPVKTQIIGAIDKLKEEAADRVQDDMNYRLTEQMIEYRSEHERLLYSLGLAGAAFKKVYFNDAIGRPTAVLVFGEDIIMPYGAANVYTAERVTHYMRKTKNDVRKLQAAGFYIDCELGDPQIAHTDIEEKKAKEQGYSLIQDERYQIYETHTDYDLEDDPMRDPNDLPSPYTITIEKGTNRVLAIYRNWEEGDPKRIKRQHFVQYTYIPGFGAYGLGLIHLVGGYARAGTSLLRQLVDAGTLANLPGGFKAKGLRVKGEDTPIEPGEFRDVDVPSGTIRDNIMPLPYKEPSQTLMALLDKITEEGRRLAAVSDLNISDMSSQAPVGTTLAILERTLKTMSAIQARVHAALRMEFKLLKRIIRDNTPDTYSYTPNDGNPQIKKQDYDVVEIIPVSDPNAATMAQRIMQYQAAIQLANGAPQIYDLPTLHKQMLEVLGIKNADQLIPTADNQSPRDPISENMCFLNGKPTQAFLYQDHDAHIATHMAFLHDPMIAQMIGQSPMAQQVQGAAMAHVAQHLAFGYRAKVEQQLGVPLPPPDQPLPPQIEIQVSRLVAQASQQLLQTNQANAQQAQAQAQSQDPMIQMQMQELQIKQQDLQRRKTEDDRKYEMEQKRLDLERQKLVSGNVNEGKRLVSQERQTGAKIKADVVKHVVGESTKHKQTNLQHVQHLQTLNHQANQNAQNRAAQVAKQESNVNKGAKE